MITSTAVHRCVGTLIVLAALAAVPVQADIIISELCDPRLNYASDRFVEIYNPGPDAVDLTGWDLVVVANGADVFTWHLSGWIDAQEALVAGDATTVAVFPVAFPDEGWSGANGSWNGKVGDGAKLLDPTGTITDLMTATGTQFENADYTRIGSVEEPNPVFTPAEWTAAPVDLATQASPGVHETTTPPAGPVIAAILTDPVQPAAGDAVHVFADVTDAGAGITAVVLRWGAAPTSLPNAIAMSAFSGNTYRTDTAIPAQAAGSLVYYRVEASNDLPATTSSALQSYALTATVTVHEIQGEAAASPYDGKMVATGGVVTACFGTTYVLQDGAGAWNGLWVRGAVAPAPGDSLTVTGRVTEDESPGLTMLVEAQVVGSTPGADLPSAVEVSTAEAGDEALEGVLVRVVDAVCAAPDLGAGEWEADDGSGSLRIGALGYRADAIFGSTYEVSGPVAFGSGRFKIEPRDAADVLWTADHAGPVVSRVAALNETTLRVFFSEAVEETGAGTVAHYAVPGLVVGGAAREAAHPDQVVLTLSAMATGDYTLTVTGIADLYGNVADPSVAPFSYFSPGTPLGYYDTVGDQTGEALRLALHDIIKNHTARSYDFAWEAYTTSDVRPDNGKVWDIYSDIPGGTPPYLYDFGVDQGGVGGAEGTGFTREHTWCKNWFGGEVSPMYTDLFTLFPCDTHMNGTRGIYAYGETTAPQFVSLNGSKVGPSSVPDYTGTVFEPIDDFKGDLARAYFYFSARYDTEDTGWPGGPAMDGATLRPWTVAMCLAWNDADPVSLKEIVRNNAIYLIQGNRNPFVDRPEFVELVFGPTATVLEDDPVNPDTPTRSVLHGAVPNPFNASTRIDFELAAAGPAELEIYDLTGRLVKRLVSGTRLGAGPHHASWDGRDDAERPVATGVYFYRLVTGDTFRTKRMMLIK